MATNSLSRKQVVQTIGGFKSREAGRKRRARRRAPARADHTHAGRGAEVCHLLADAAGADNTYGLIPNYYGMVSLVIESAALFFCVAQVKPASEVEKARQHILGHGTPIGQPARGGHQNIRAPKIGIEKIAGAGGKLVHPFQAGRARS